MILQARKVCNSCRTTVAVKRLFGYRTVEDYVTVDLHESPCYVTDSQRKTPMHYCSNCWSNFQRVVTKERERR